MSSQKAGRGGLLHAGYPHQGTVKDGIAVRQGLFAVAAAREHFSWVSRIGGHPGKMFPSRSDCKQTLPDCNSGCPRAAGPYVPNYYSNECL